MNDLAAGPEPIPPAVATDPIDASDSILVVEDNEVNRRIAVALLSRSGYAIDTANDGIEALEAVRTKAYALILMDIHMPRMDGIEATRLIRRMDGPCASTPIAALTANAMNGARTQYLAAGMDDYLAKPYTMDQLNSLIKRWAGAASPRRDTPVSAAALLDTTVLAGIAEATSEDCVAAMVDAYLERSGELAQSISRHRASGDVAAVSAAAHELAGMAGAIGVTALGDLARRLERACRDGDSTIVSALSAEIGPLAERSSKVVRQHAAGFPVGAT